MISLQQIKQHLKLGKRLLVVEESGLTSNPISACVFLLTKEGFQIETFKEFDAIEEVKNEFGNKYPVIIGLSSQQVLTKEITSFKKENADFSLAFPNINYNDFYFENFYNAQRCFVSICRKKVVDELVDLYHTKGFQVISLYIGNSYLIPLQEFISYETLYSKTASIDYTDDVKISPNKDNYTVQYNIAGTDIQSAFILPLAVGLYFFNPRAEIFSNTKELNNRLYRDYSQSRYYKLGVVTSISILVIALLINSLVFASTFKKVEQLTQNQQLFSIQKETLDKTKASVDKKAALIKSIQQTGFSSSSQFISSIIEDMPSSITLSNVNYQPLIKGVRPKKEILQKIKTIIFEGKTNEKEAFFDWTTGLEKNTFLKQLIIEDFKDISARTASFNILIYLK